MATEKTQTNKFIQPVRLSHKDPIFPPPAVDAANQINVWHKFIVYNVAKEDKTAILNHLIETATPMLLIPVMYEMETENKASFLTFCRSTTVQKFLNQKLQIKVNSKVIHYDIVLSFLAFKDMQLNPQQIITNAIRSCFGKEQLNKRSLNLSNFVNNEMLGSIYCPIHIPVVFDQVLRYARTGTQQNARDGKLPIRELILRNNNLETVNFTDKIFNFNFTKLDVRNNKICDIALLKPFTEYKITDLWIDGNPLCNNYDNPKDYIAAVRTVFPHLQLLDGEAIGTDKKFIPAFNKHFIRIKSKTNLIKQFVEHFFTCYDQEDRVVLNGLYDAGALFSMTVGPISDNSHKQIIKYFGTNRNLLKFVDYAKCTEFLLHGPEKIIAALRKEPATLHKLRYLEIDLLYSTANCFAVAVQGPFLYRKHNVRPLWFHRTLIVTAKEDNEYCIINDQYHIDNCPHLHDVDLSELKFESDKSIPAFNPVSFSSAEKYQLLKLLQELTTMNTEYADKYLKEAKWDIRKAIKTFMDSYLNNVIPPEAFRW